MARKRMISPEIWESQDFSSLSDLAKIVFISLFSHADDQGRGRADPSFVKNTTFPYDENRRVADIKSALSEIARSMSVQFYSVNGIEYYFMKSWERWQKVDKPSPSKLPPPPFVGRGGDIHSGEKFDDGSASVRGIFDERSPTNRIEKNINKYPPISPQGEGVGEGSEKDIFMRAYPLLSAAKKYDDSKIDYALLKKMFDRSERLKKTYSMKWVCENYYAIISGAFTDKAVCESETHERERWYYARRQEEEDRVEKLQGIAFQTEGYQANEKRLNDLTIKIAFAEVKQSSDLEELKKQFEECTQKRRSMLATIGLTEDNLKVRYHCAKCNDTGFDVKTGQPCDCYQN